MNILYKGQTSNLENRLKEHLNGKCRTTRTMHGFKLVFVQICEGRKSARELEKYLKSGYGRETINDIIGYI